MGPKGQNWSKWVQLGHKGKNRSKWVQRGSNGSKLIKIGLNAQNLSNGSRWLQIAPNGSRWVQGVQMHQHGSQGSQWVQMGPNESKCVKIGPKWAKMGQNVCVSISKTVTSEIGFCTEFADISAVRAKLSIYPNTCALNAANHPPLNKCLNCLLLLKISSCDSILSLKVKQCYTSISDGVIRPNVH